MKKFKISPLLYNKLTELFPMGSKDRDFNIACETLRYISKKSYKKTGTDSNYVEFGIVLQRLKFSSRANKVIQLLKNEGILICYSSKSSKESYVVKYGKDDKGQKIQLNDKGICKQYRLNTIYTLQNYIKTNISPLLCTEGSYISYNKVNKRYSSKVLTPYEKSLYIDFIETLEGLEIDFEKLKENVLNKVKNVKMQSFKTGKNINAEKFEVIFLSSGQKRYLTKKKARSIAKHNYETLIKDGKNYYIGGKEQFLAYKKNNMLNSYLDAIERLKEGDLYAKRNEVNGRLDTNFTNLPNFMLKTIMEDNDLVSIDLANSQFAILAHRMEKEGYDTPDFTLFKEAAYKGNLYDKATELMGYDTRNETKTGFFETLFSRSTNNSERKNKLLSVYPTVIKYTDDVKNAGKYQDLSIGLQKNESEIFIDNLYPKLKDKLAFVLTKHDSFIVKKDKVEEALQIIQDYFDEINFKGTMKIES